MLLGLAVLARRWHIGPRSDQTVLSQIMAMAVGRHWAYYVVSLTITVVLALAANTSFGGLPVLASLLARDNYLPHLFAQRGDRQVFANGIWVLAGMSGPAAAGRRGNTNAMIPLFAIGVFIGFTLAQAGPRRALAPAATAALAAEALINGTGAVVTGVATLVFLISKFLEGAWVVVLAVPVFIYLFSRIHAYYRQLGVDLAIDEVPVKPRASRTLVVVPITQVSKLSEYAISEALSLGDEVRAVSVVLEQGDASDEHEEALRASGPGGTAACRSRSCTPSTRRSSDPSGTTSTGCSRTRTTRSSCSSPWSSPTSCATASSTTRSTSPCRHRCARGPTSWWPGSRCRSSEIESGPAGDPFRTS